ncbi:hypothetical protein HNR34_002525 [Geobacillus subterraneus]
MIERVSQKQRDTLSHYDIHTEQLCNFMSRVPLGINDF